MVGAMDPYWGSLHCFFALIVPPLTQMYKWILVTEQWGKGAAIIIIVLVSKIAKAD